MITLSNPLWGRLRISVSCSEHNLCLLQTGEQTSNHCQCTGHKVARKALLTYCKAVPQNSSQSVQWTKWWDSTTPLGCSNTFFFLQLKTYALIQGSASMQRSVFNLYLPNLNAMLFFTIRERPVFLLQDELLVSDVLLTQSLGLHSNLTGVLQGLICWASYEVLAHCATETLRVPKQLCHYVADRKSVV